MMKHLNLFIRIKTCLSIGGGSRGGTKGICFPILPRKTNQRSWWLGNQDSLSFLPTKSNVTCLIETYLESDRIINVCFNLKTRNIKMLSYKMNL